MRRRRRTALGAASALLLLAGVACGAPASEDAGTSDLGSPETTDAPASTTSAPDPQDGGPRPTSGLAAEIEALGSSRYEPDDHRVDERRPVDLAIPALGVAGAPVRAVGVEPNGDMEIPPADEVGWYRFGAAPGQPGSAVLAAHIAYDGVDGVFRYLDRLRPGDEVVVGVDDGTTARFRVTELATYRKEALPDEVFSREGPPRLVLITCGGSFNPSLRSYDSNVVAYAEPW